ncbi:MAG TPA: MFS transporter [Methylomirabilota bacterium]|nr:MFS transporter [Methylomirabilota bacterium]
MPGVLYFFSYFHRIAPVVVAADLMRAFSVSAAALGNLSAIYPYCFAAMALPGGSLADTLGPRRTLTLGAITMSAGSILFGLAPTFALAFGGRLLVGLGASVMLIVSLRLAAEWFRPDEFATMSGWSQSVGSVGALVGTTPLALLVEQIGWRWSFAAIGGFTFVLALACFAFVRDRPQDLGLPPINPGRAPAGLPLREVLAGIPPVVRNSKTWTAVLTSTGVYGAFLAFFGLWGVPYLIQVHGLSRVNASNLVALGAVGLLLSAPLVGWLSDRLLGVRKPPLVLATALYAAAWAVLVLPGAPVPASWLGPLCFLLGVGSGSVVLVFACVREVNDPRYVGVALGFHNLPVFLGFALMQWLTGLTLDSQWEGMLAGGTRVYGPAAYRAAFGLCLAVSLGSLVSACLVTETRCRNIWKAR